MAKVAAGISTPMPDRTETQPPAKRSPARLLGKIFYLVFLAIVFVFSVAVIFVYSLCLFKEEYVAGQAAIQMREYTGRPWQVDGPVRPVLFPSPGLSLTKVSLPAASINRMFEAGESPPFVTVQKVRVELDFWALLRGVVKLKRVDLRSVYVSMAYGLDGLPLWEPHPLEEFDGMDDACLESHQVLADMGFDEFDDESGDELDFFDEAPDMKNGEPESGGKTLQPGQTGSTTIAAPKKDIPVSSGTEQASAPQEQRQGEEAVSLGDLKASEQAPSSLNLPQSNASLPVGEEFAEGSTPGEIAVNTPSPLTPVLEQMVEMLDPDFREYLPALVVTDALFEYYEPDGALALQIAKGEVLFDPLAQENPLTFSGRTELPTIGISSGFFAKVSLGEEFSLLQGQVTGEMRIAPENLMERFVVFTYPFTWQKSGTIVDLTGVSLVSGKDTISADLTLDLTSGTITGPVRAHDVNMPKWFKFARNLPPGLQHALSTLSGTFDLFLDSKGVWATNGVFTSRALTVTGSITAEDFSKPVVEVDLDIPVVDLDFIFPFLATSDTEVSEWSDLVFDEPPLVPYPGDGGSNLPDVGYDVTVRIGSGQVHGIPANKGVVRCRPDEKDNTIVTFDIPDFLKGTLKGRLEIAGRSVKMIYDAARLDIARTPENREGGTQFGGLFTGKVSMKVDIDANGFWLDPWDLTVGGVLETASIGARGAGKWKLNSKKVDLKGNGKIFTSREKGIRADGVWDIKSEGLSSSWYPDGNDHLDGTLEGSIAWAPKPPAKGGKPVKYWRGIANIYGDLRGQGTMGLPISTHISPTTGKFTTALDWSLIKDEVKLNKAIFEGMGGICSGDVALNFAGEFQYQADTEMKVQPKILLKHWKMVPESFELPDVITGSGVLKGNPGQMEFSNLNLKVDGSPVRGSISKRVTGTVDVPASIAAKDKAAGQSSRKTMGKADWNISLQGDLLDLDKYLPPEKKDKPRSTEPWDFSSLYGQNIAAKVDFKGVRYKKLNTAKARLDMTLKDEELLAQFTSSGFYDGQLDIKIQGHLSPVLSQLKIQRGQGGAQNFRLGKLFSDMSGETSHYDGLAEIQFDLSGSMAGSADLPGGLSGNWGLLIKNGTYPAFLGTEGGLRNTFSHAAVSGVMEKGVMRWDNLTLSGSMIDMEGRGEVDLNANTLNVIINATVARVPTIPMHIEGNIDSPTMNVRGQALITENVQSAGSTIFGLIKGVLELPVRAIQGVGDLISGDSDKDKNKGGRPAPGGATRNTEDVRQ